MSWGSSCWLLQRRHLLHCLRESRQGNPPDQVLPGGEEEVGDEVMRRLARRPCDGWLPVRSRRVWCNVYRWWHGGSHARAASVVGSIQVGSGSPGAEFRHI